MISGVTVFVYCMYSVIQYVFLSWDETRKRGTLIGTLINSYYILSASDQLIQLSYAPVSYQ